jgi:hypothetical protein
MAASGDVGEPAAGSEDADISGPVTLLPGACLQQEPQLT